MSKDKPGKKPPVQSKPEPQPVVLSEDEYNFGKEMRSNSSMERFESWTDSMQKNNPSTKNQQQAKGKADEDDYGADDFEDYDEDFEADEEEAPKPVPVAQSKVTKPAQQETPAASAKPTAKVSQSSASVPAPQTSAERAEAKPVKKFESNMQMSFSSLRMTDPRGLRIQKLLNSKVMELQVDKHTILNQLPITPYELYMRNLRLSNAAVRQIGVPVDQETRDMDCNTDAIETADQSVQFSYGDDTAFYRTMEDIKARRNKTSADHKSNGTNSTSTGTGTSTGATQTGHSSADASSSAMGATRLTTFLQHASRICEHILADQEESKSSVEDRSQRGDQKHSLFDASKDWVTMGSDKASGGNETVRSRRIACTKFSTLQPHLLMTAHPYPTDDTAELDLKPYKGLYCVWDAGNSGGPQYVLESTGQPTVCCFSATQTHFVVGGTLEGSLHLWDLREDSSIHKDRDALDLKISKGIRKPTYSTNLAYLSLSTPASATEHSSSATDEASWQHSAPVVQIESLSTFSSGSQSSQTSQASQGSVISQFVSVDEAGLVIFWVTQQNVLFGHGEDLQRAPWGGVTLVQTRQIHTHSHGLSHFRPSNKLGANGGGGGGAALQGTVSMACIPSDLSTLLIAGSEGEVNKLSRFGECTAPLHYRRARSSASDITLPAGPDQLATTSSDKSKRAKAQEMRLFSAVSCLCVYSPANSSRLSSISAEGRDGTQQEGKSSDDAHNHRSGHSGVSSASSGLNKAPLVLVGRHDGTLDLFHLDCEAPLQSWDLASFAADTSGGSKPATKSTSKSGNKGSAVVLLQWGARPGVFFVADRAGSLYHFDLLVQTHGPVSVESVGVTDKVLSRCIDISKPRAVTGTYFVTAVAPPASKDGGDVLKVRRGNSSLHKDIDVSAEEGLYSKLFALTAARFAAPTVLFVPPGEGNADNGGREGKK